MKISVFRKCRVGPSTLPSAALVKRAVGLALEKRAKAFGEVNVVFCCDAAITRLNRRFLGKNRVTDVIAFGYDFGAAGSGGDIYVCAPQGLRQAPLYGNSARRELLTLCVHGALHLSGMDDANAAQRRRMDKAAERVLAATAQPGR